MQEKKLSALRISKKRIIIILVFIVWVIYMVNYVVKMIIAGETESNVVVTSQYIDIQGDHGVRLSMNAITNIELKNAIPKIKQRVWGYNSFSSAKKGKFKLKGMGVGRIYIFTSKGPYLYLSMGEEFVIIGFKDPDNTRQLYEQIVSQRE